MAEKITKIDDLQNGQGKDDKSMKVRFGLRLKFSLSVISLVSVIIVSITGFLVWRESRLLREQIFQLTEREIIHLANTALESIGADELAIIAAMKDLEKIPYLRYAFVLDKNDNIIQYFDKREGRDIGRPLNDGISRKMESRTDEQIMIVSVQDPLDRNGRIYDFSRLVFSKFNNNKIGSALIGLSDEVIRHERENLVKIVIPIFLLFLGISILGSIVLATVTIKPIRELSHGASIIGKGDLDYRLNINRSDELGQLAREFNVMTAMIKEAKDREIESRIMEEQLEMARDIQEGLNPMGFYDKNGIQIKGFTRAAKGVGGDYFDYIDIDENRVGALISDVSGKGVPASLVMVMIRTVFTSYISRKDVDCSKVVRAINDSLSADFAIDKFATLFFMIYNRKTEELAFANAGHGPLFCYRAAMGACTTTKLEGVPIGIMEDVEYKQAKVKLNRGDIVVMYTDGITDMRNVDKEEYGLKRVHRLLLDNSRLNANDFVELIVNDVDSFRGEASPHDDMTVLVFKRED